jgi:hypothetical protein
MPGIRVDRNNRVLTLSQSWLHDFLICNERARRQITQRIETHNDATARGTAVHRFMEERLRGAPYSMAAEEAHLRLEALMERDDFQWIQVKRPDTLHRHVQACIDAYDEYVLPQVERGGLVEHTLSHTLCVVQGWTVVLTGTPDYLAPRGVLWDWKTSAQYWERYEEIRWNVQSTVYTWLASQEADIPIEEFTFVVAVVPHGDLQIIDLERDKGHWEWLKHQVEPVVTLIEHLPGWEWPLNDQHWLCSPRWCPFWSDCKGQYITNPQETAR